MSDSNLSVVTWESPASPLSRGIRSRMKADQAHQADQGDQGNQGDEGGELALAPMWYMGRGAVPAVALHCFRPRPSPAARSLNDQNSK